MTYFINIDLGEYWKPLKYKDIKPMYLISNYGRVKNKNTGKIISNTLSEKGYPMVGLMSKEGKQKTYKLHRLVAYNFLPLPNFDDGNNWTVNHKDGNKQNNQSDNLEWVTFSENIRHAFKTGLNKARKGESNQNNKYSENLIQQICMMMEQGYTNREIKSIIKKEHGIELNRFLLYDLRHRNTWPHITQLYKY